MTRIAVIGGGKIGEALIAGLVSAGRPAKDLVVAERFAARGKELADEYGLRVTDDTADAADGADVVVIAVKPDAVGSVLADLAKVQGAGDRLIVTLAAGHPTVFYENAMPAGTPVVRVMPNTPMLVNEAISAVSAGRFASADHVALVVDMLSAVGKVVEVPEKQMDAVTAVSGSGPAYVFLMVEAMIDAGVGLGLTRQLATELAVQTVRGAGVLMTDSGLSPVDLRASVTSPGGTTAEAIRELDSNGLRGAFYQAMRACAARSAELGAASGKL